MFVQEQRELVRKDLLLGAPKIQDPRKLKKNCFFVLSENAFKISPKGKFKISF